MAVDCETFTDSEIKHAIETWLEYGEQSYAPGKGLGEHGQKGYFSGSGFAARCLRFHLCQLEDREDQ